jgi:hypothetical protein
MHSPMALHADALPRPWEAVGAARRAVDKDCGGVVGDDFDKPTESET